MYQVFVERAAEKDLKRLSSQIGQNVGAALRRFVTGRMPVPLHRRGAPPLLGGRRVVPFAPWTSRRASAVVAQITAVQIDRWADGTECHPYRSRRRVNGSLCGSDGALPSNAR